MSETDMGTTIRESFEWGVLIASIIAGLVIGWIRLGGAIKETVGSWFSHKSKNSTKRDSFTLDNNIHEQMNKLRYESDACRVKIFQFHNGGNFATGKSMKKLSTTHESAHPGMAITVKPASDQPMSLFSDMLELCHQNETNLFNTNSLKETYFKSYLQSNHVLMFSILPLRSTKGEEIGCILCEWCAWSFADRVNQDTFADDFREARNSIEYLISIDNTKDKRKSR